MNLTKEQFINSGALWWHSMPWVDGYQPDMNFCVKVCSDFLDDFLKNEKIEYGDDDYDWTENGVEDFFSCMEE